VTPVRFLYVFDLQGMREFRRWEGLTGHGFSGVGMVFRGLSVDRKNPLSHQARIPREQLLNMVWTKETLLAAEKEYAEGVARIDATQYPTKVAEECARRDVGRQCFGCRGHSPASTLLPAGASVLCYCVDGLHLKNNCTPLTFSAMMEQWASLGVLELVKRAAGKKFAVLFGEKACSAKADTYSDAKDGNLYTQLILLLPKLLHPILVKAQTDSCQPLLHLYTQHLEFARCLAVMVKATSTMDPDGYADRIVQYELAVERWAQLLLFASLQPQLCLDFALCCPRDDEVCLGYVWLALWCRQHAGH
jgi:hypothetical protein